MKTFLSVDLDFWRDCPQKSFNFLNELRKLSLILETNFFQKTEFFVDHHDMLDFVNETKFDKLINIDYHSDIADYDIVQNGKTIEVRNPELNCGTWVNYVDRKDCKEYVWIHPHRIQNIDRGYCHSINTPFAKNCEEVCGWKKTSKLSCQSNALKKVLSENIVAIGIAISPDYFEGYVNIVDMLGTMLYYFPDSRDSVFDSIGKLARPENGWPPYISQRKCRK